ncbi:MAG: molybdenum cofactor biosynthesis protein B [Pirellula sp.]
MSSTEGSLSAEKRESESTQLHKRSAPKCLIVGILTVSDTRTLESDEGGRLIEQYLVSAGHSVKERIIVRDERELISQSARDLLALDGVQALLVTGGTGLSARDQTTEGVEMLYDAGCPGFGVVVRMLSFQEIGSSAMLSRASAGRHGTQIIITMPGSPAGVRLAMERLILPELAHLVHHAGN